MAESKSVTSPLTKEGVKEEKPGGKLRLMEIAVTVFLIVVIFVLPLTRSLNSGIFISRGDVELVSYRVLDYSIIGWTFELSLRNVGGSPVSVIECVLTALNVLDPVSKQPAKVSLLVLPPLELGPNQTGVIRVYSVLSYTYPVIEEINGTVQFRLSGGGMTWMSKEFAIRLSASEIGPGGATLNIIGVLWGEDRVTIKLNASGGTVEVRAVEVLWRGEFVDMSGLVQGWLPSLSPGEVGNLTLLWFYEPLTNYTFRLNYTSWGGGMKSVVFNATSPQVEPLSVNITGSAWTGEGVTVTLLSNKAITVTRASVNGTELSIYSLSVPASTPTSLSLNFKYRPNTVYVLSLTVKGSLDPLVFTLSSPPPVSASINVEFAEDALIVRVLNNEDKPITVYDLMVNGSSYKWSLSLPKDVGTHSEGVFRVDLSWEFGASYTVTVLADHTEVSATATAPSPPTLNVTSWKWGEDWLALKIEVGGGPRPVTISEIRLNTTVRYPYIKVYAGQPVWYNVTDFDYEFGAVYSIKVDGDYADTELTVTAPKMEVDLVDYKFTKDKLELTLNNGGEISVRVRSVTVSYYYFSVGATVEPGKNLTISLNFSCDSDKEYELTVYLSRTSLDFTIRSPPLIKVISYTISPDDLTVTFTVEVAWDVDISRVGVATYPGAYVYWDITDRVSPKSLRAGIATLTISWPLDPISAEHVHDYSAYYFEVVTSDGRSAYFSFSP